MRFRYLFFFWLPLLVLVFIAGLTVLAIQPDPAATARGELSNDDARQAKTLIQRYNAQIFAADDQDVTIRASQDDINILLAFGTRISERLNGEAIVGEETVAVAITLDLPSTPLGRFANFRIRLRENEGNIEVATFSIGRLRLPGTVARPLSRFVARSTLNFLLKNGRGSEILNAFDDASIREGAISVAYHPEPEMMLALKDAATRQARSVVVLTDAARVLPYLESISEFNQTQSSPIPFAKAVSHIFEVAASRSVDGDAREENKAAILALAIRFGDKRLVRLGDFENPGAVTTWSDDAVLELSGREDLARHFLVSAALALGGQGIAGVVGEAKEMLDTGEGGSGFSFSDLAADRAGARFSAAVSADRESAQRLQAFMAQLSDEGAIFPPISGLPDNLTDTEFRRQFGDVNSVAYQNMVADIDRRLDSLDIFSEM